MGRRLLLVITVLTLVGCWRSSRPAEPTVVYEPCQPTPAPLCPEVPKDNFQVQLLSVQRECFQSIEQRESVIAELRKENNYLKQDLESAKADAQNWRDRFYDSSN